MIKRGMHEPRKFDAVWWVDGQEHPLYPGVLAFDPDEALSLEITVPAVRASGTTVFETGVPVFRESIIGRHVEQEPVTLIGCKILPVFKNDAFVKLSITAEMALFGGEYRSWETVARKSVSVKYSLLHKWMWETPFLDRKNEQGKFVGVEFSPRKDIRIDLTNSINLVIWRTWGCSYKASGYEGSAYELTAGELVQFQFPEARPIASIFDSYIRGLQRLLTLFAGTEVFLDEVFSLPEADNGLVLLQRNPGIRRANRGLPSVNMLVQFADVRDHIGDIIRKWFEIQERLSDVLNLLFIEKGLSAQSPNQGFLVLAQALEVYHRSSSLFENSVEDKAVFDARRQRIFDAIPEEAIWLKEKLNFANEKHLAMRIRDVLDAHKQEVGDFMESPDEFSKNVRATRNHLTHYATKKNRVSQIPSGESIVKLVDQLRGLLHLCVFQELGISGEPVRRLIYTLNHPSARAW